VGFCMGGTVSFMAAARVPGIKAAAVYYGNRILVPDVEGGPTLLDEASNIKGPLIGFFGALDAGMTGEQLEVVKGKLKNAGVDADINLYEGAGHGFMRDDDPGVFNKAASDDAWEKTLAFFKKNL
jgi:carboxymethylenebutenolidase